MKMMDMGNKMSDKCCETVGPPSQSRIDYPSLHLDEKIPDGLEKKEIGDVIDCHIQIKVRRIEMNNRMEAGKPKKTFSMAFDVVKMGIMDKSNLKDKMAKMKPGEM